MCPTHTCICIRHFEITPEIIWPCPGPENVQSRGPDWTKSGPEKKLVVSSGQSREEGGSTGEQSLLSMTVLSGMTVISVAQGGSAQRAVSAQGGAMPERRVREGDCIILSRL